MAFEQEPIKIEIPVEEEEVVYVAEERRRDVAAQRKAQLSAGVRRTATRAREAWQSERRQEVQAGVVHEVQRGARASRIGLVRGLNWLSARLAGLAERFTPVE